MAGAGQVRSYPFERYSTYTEINTQTIEKLGMTDGIEHHRYVESHDDHGYFHINVLAHIVENLYQRHLISCAVFYAECTGL